VFYFSACSGTATGVASCISYNELQNDLADAEQKVVKYQHSIEESRTSLNSLVSIGHSFRIKRQEKHIKDIEEVLNHWSSKSAALKPRIRLKLVECINDLMKEIRFAEMRNIKLQNDFDSRVIDLRCQLNHYLSLYQISDD
jgi:hypothetical protein